MKPDIAVVIPVFNGEKTIEKSIKSLLNQTFKNWLAVIINDGSTDSTRSILEKFQNDGRFYILHFEKNLGRPSARQKALDIVKKLNIKYMCMLDADDIYYPNKLKYQYDFMEKNTHFALMSCSIAVSNLNNKLYKVIEPYTNDTELIFNEFLKYKEIPHASSIIRVNQITKDFSSELTLSEDQDFLRRNLIKKPYYFSPIIVYIYNRDFSFSYNKYRQSIFYSIKAIKNLPINKFKKIKAIVLKKTKLAIVKLLFLMGLEASYLKLSGRKPTLEEVKCFNEIFKKNTKH